MPGGRLGGGGMCMPPGGKEGMLGGPRPPGGGGRPCGGPPGGAPGRLKDGGGPEAEKLKGEGLKLCCWFWGSMGFASAWPSAA